MSPKATAIDKPIERARAWWASRAPRERRILGLAAWVLAVSGLWGWLLAPAWKTLRQAPEQHARLDAQIARMQAMAGEVDQVRALNASPPPGRSAVVRALEQSLPQLGEQARLSLQGDRASVTLQGTSAEALALWLNQMRINARLLPVQAQLRSAAEPGRWVGQITLSGPGLREDGP